GGGRAEWGEERPAAGAAGAAAHPQRHRLHRPQPAHRHGARRHLSRQRAHRLRRAPGRHRDHGPLRDASPRHRADRAARRADRPRLPSRGLRRRRRPMTALSPADAGFEDHSADLARDARREQSLLLCLTLPSMVVIAGVLFAPIVWLVWQSLIDQNGNFTLVHFQTLFDEPKRISYLQNTFLLAAEVTVICGVLAYPLAFALTTLPERLRKVCMFF